MKSNIVPSETAMRSPIARFGDAGLYRHNTRCSTTTYPGGKNGAGVYQRIINHMPPHRVYVEPFLGGGAIMRAKRPACCSIGIDADDHVLIQAREWRIPGLELVHANSIEWLASTTLSGDTLMYLDPPYLLSTRRQHRSIYRYELTDHDHYELLRIIKRMSCMVIISGYRSDLYDRELAGWRTDRFQTMTRGGKLATEWLWMNFDTPIELHDYRYLGDNYRERERIKRKQARWRRRLIEMPATERYAILSVLGDMNPTTNTGDGRRQSSPRIEMAPGDRIGINDGDDVGTIINDDGGSGPAANSRYDDATR
jgi:DNA adenine methylase